VSIEDRTPTAHESTIDTESRTAPTPLPISSAELLSGLAPGRTRELELRHGNGDLYAILDLLGVAGPFRTLSPWELEDEKGRHLLHAGGYAALPFGERYGPLVDYATRFLAEGGGGTLGHHLSEARAALETNLIALLAAHAPSHHDSRVIFSNSGAEAIEVALKLVRAGRPKARRLLTFERGFHGKTFGALSVTPNEEFQGMFRPLLPDVEVLPYGDPDALERSVRSLGPDTIAGVIVEPVQGEGGVISPDPAFLPTLQRLKEQHGFLVVADEIQSGLGRSGHWFASVAGGLDPDVITLAKPLGGGLVAIGATAVRHPIAQAMLPGLKAKRHSSTFAGNALAMAVGLRSLELLVEGDLAGRAREP
jgi:acetylornithine/succinyldiaminopimelate/putrescine aminotransferase